MTDQVTKAPEAPRVDPELHIAMVNRREYLGSKYDFNWYESEGAFLDALGQLNRHFGGVSAARRQSLMQHFAMHLDVVPVAKQEPVGV